MACQNFQNLSVQYFNFDEMSIKLTVPVFFKNYCHYLMLMP